jgi:hypothetical protein
MDPQGKEKNGKEKRRSIGMNMKPGVVYMNPRR